MSRRAVDDCGVDQVPGLRWERVRATCGLVLFRRFLGREEFRREYREKREYEDTGPLTNIPRACSACPP